MNWLAPKCPVDDKTRKWIESSTRWMISAFELGSLKNVTVVLPTPEFFPGVYSAEEPQVRRLFDRVCDLMEVDASRLELELVPDSRAVLQHQVAFGEYSGKGVAGQYQNVDGKVTIKISTSHLKNPTALVATIAHELGHVLLLGDNLSAERADHEPMTDLLTVVLGLGIFSANSAFNFRQWQGGGLQGWSAERLGYLTEPMFGYALGFFAWLREETKPAWAQYLQGDVKHYFKAGLRYLANAKPAN